MNRFIGRAVASVLIICGAAQAQAQNNACALVMGQDAAGNLQSLPLPGQPNEQVAGQAAMAHLQRNGYQPLDGRTVTGGAIALVIYRDRIGQLRPYFSASNTALSAIMGGLGAVGGAGRDPSYPPYVRWVNCYGTPPPSPKELNEMTWSTSLTQLYGGYQAKVIELQGNYGSLLMVAGQAQPPPVPTPAPPNPYPLGNPLGCWQRNDGNVITIAPDGVYSDGSPQFLGVHTVLSAQQAQTGVRPGSYALKMFVLRSKPGYFQGGYNARDGWDQTSQFIIKDDVLYTVAVEGVSRPPREMLAWRRVPCPPGGAR